MCKRQLASMTAVPEALGASLPLQACSHLTAPRDEGMANAHNKHKHKLESTRQQQQHITQQECSRMETTLGAIQL